MSCSRRSLEARSRVPGFTLAELLVVIGIIGLLLAILLPALAAARRSTRSVTCSSQQRVILQAMLGRAADTEGYLPLAGTISVGDIRSPGGGLATQLNDSGRRRYDYLQALTVSEPPTGESVLPTELSLMKWLGEADVPDRDAEVAGWLAQGGRGRLQAIFNCPEVAERGVPKPSVALRTGSMTWITLHATATDYGFNEGVLGFDYRDPQSRRLRAQLSRVAEPARCMLLGDMGSRPNVVSLMTWRPTLDTIPGPIPLSSQLLDASGQGFSQSFDVHRHAGRINLAMADGHVEVRKIDATNLGEILLLAQ